MMKCLLMGFVAGMVGLAAVAGCPRSARAQTLDRPTLQIGVGGKPLLYYLPLTIAERKGFFKEEGLDVTINDFGGGAKSLQALIGGSVDAVTGAYEHTIRMQEKDNPSLPCSNLAGSRHRPWRCQGQGWRGEVGSRSEGVEARRHRPRFIHPHGLVSVRKGRGRGR